METEFQNAIGKGKGEVSRDIADFLSMPFIVGKKKQVDLCSLVEQLNMHGQFSFALLSEALAQGWEIEEAIAFYRRAVSSTVSPALSDAVCTAFLNPDSEEFRSLSRKYSNRFTALDGSYWATVLAIGIDGDCVEDVMRYLRLFTVTLMEFAYMEDKNPEVTYAWCYYESFRAALESFAQETREPLPLQVIAIGGTVGKKTAASYTVSLGVDVLNPNRDKMARDVRLDVTLKDKNGNVITTIKDTISSIDPLATYHYAVTRRVRGARTAGISARAKASSHLRLETPIMGHIAVTEDEVAHDESGTAVSLLLKNNYDRPLRSLTVHCQMQNEDGKPLGGAVAWVLDGFTPGEVRQVTAQADLKIDSFSRILYSIDFDAIELVAD